MQPENNKLKIIQHGSAYYMQRIAKNRHRLSRIIKEYEHVDDMFEDVSKLMDGEVTEEELTESWKPSI